jgi:hypothetical protein
LSENNSEQQLFGDFVATFYRLSGCEAPRYEWDGQSSIAFDVFVDEVKFSVGYDAATTADARLFAYCALGPVPSSDEGPVFRRLMGLNLALSREHGASYCLDPRSAEAVCYMRRNLSGLDVEALRDELACVAERVEQWRRDYFLSDAEGAAGDAAHAWALFA